MVNPIFKMENSEIKKSISDKKGSYCLVFHLEKSKNVAIGKLGTFYFPKGYYYYFGSAKGSGGLQARINRHVSMEKKKFWHIDYLRADLIFIAAVYSIEINKECEWGQKIERKFSFDVPANGFGSSDCLSSCKTHLLHSNMLVDLNEFCESLGTNNLEFIS